MIRFQNQARFFTALKKIVPKLDRNLVEVNKEAAKEMVFHAKRFAPQDRVLTASIYYGKNPRPGSFFIQAGGPTTTVQTSRGPYDYALGWEYGNSRTPAHPFFWPAFRMTKDAHKYEATKVLRKVISDAGF